MKRKLLAITFVVLGIQLSIAQDAPEYNEAHLEALQKEISNIQNEFSNIEKEITLLKRENRNRLTEIKSLDIENDTLKLSLDSLFASHTQLYKIQKADKDTISQRINMANNTIIHNQSVLENRSLWGGIIVILIVLLSSGILLYLFKRIKSGTNSIDEVRKAQDALQNAQTKMQEESINLDNKLLTIIGQQMNTPTATNNQGTTSVDHSLALKVADEIVRIELNLSRMDSSIKGYKQLAKAVQRIKDNFQANGYEIVDMLGKPYIAGLKAAVTFVTDENLEKGQQIISKIIKPQINYQQQMIQAAEIEVSQPE
ncbi:hypothetical protein [Mediterranea sp. An20]|uniref:hypothetical protein n=1 Tax=Mediterranea sp. An20 TaxID=1965586 RepID=UPI001EF5D3F2|nr:hypothetical protein [Mediterranea sp. An20]